MNPQGLGAALDQAQLSYIAAGAGVSYLVTGEVLTSKLTGEESGGSCVVSEMTVLPQGGPPLHRHMQHETLYVIEGELEVTGVRDGKFRTHSIQAGMLAHIPGCVPHAFYNPSDVPARVLSFNGPAGLESFYAEAGVLLSTLDVRPSWDAEQQRERYLEAALDHGVEPIDAELFDQREGYRAAHVHCYEATPGPALAVSSSLVRFLARREQTESLLTILELSQLPGGSTPLVSHYQSSVFYVLNGTLSFTARIDGTDHSFDAASGSTVLIPRKSLYSFSNKSAGLARMLAFYSPGGLEAFITAIGETVEPHEFLLRTGSTPDAEEVQRLADIGVLYGVNVVSNPAS